MSQAAESELRLDAGVHEATDVESGPRATLTTSGQNYRMRDYGLAPVRVVIERSDDLVVGTFAGVTRREHTMTAEVVAEGEPTLPIRGRFQFERDRAVTQK